MTWIPWRYEANYEKVDLDCSSANRDPRTRTSIPTKPKILYLLVSLNIAILLLVLVGGHAILGLPAHLARPSVPLSSSPNLPIRISNCGTTPSEARALGCRFESNNLAWVPPECYDEQLGAEWDAQDWLYAINSTKTPIPKSQVLEGNLKHVWVTWGQHIAHCALLVRKYQRAVMFNWPLDNWTSSYEHTAHCARSYTEWRYMANPNELNAVVNLKFPTCSYEWKDGLSGPR